MQSESEYSRTKNTVLNFAASAFSQILILVLRFVTRTVFINTLGTQYLGINGLFTNILDMLSLMNLGVGTAMLYKLYKPLSDKDIHRIQLLMKFYKNAYRIVGFAIAIVGCLLIPLLPYIISDYDSLAALNINAVIVYCLYLFQSVSTYLFFAYKSAIVQADQKEYKLTVWGYVFTIGLNVVQIFILLTTKNFLVYTGIVIVFNLAQNLVYAKIADRLYPYIKVKIRENLPRMEVKDILKDCGALFLYQINAVVLKATDNIVLSAFIGLTIVGLYSNYTMIYYAIKNLLNMLYSALAPSLGNLHASASIEHEYLIFKVVNLITVILYGTAFVGVSVVADEFIKVWLDETYVIAQPFSCLMAMEIYTFGLRNALGKFRNTMGLFQQGKYRPLAGMVLNIVISVYSVQKIGIYGVLLGTVLADWLTFMWYDPYIIFKYGFKGFKKVTEYYAINIKYLIIVFLSTIICMLLSCNTAYDNICSVLLHSVFCVIVTCGLLFIFCFRSEEFQYLIGKFKNILFNQIVPYMKSKR